jgi:hypothetical protein
MKTWSTAVGWTVISLAQLPPSVTSLADKQSVNGREAAVEVDLQLPLDLLFDIDLVNLRRSAKRIVASSALGISVTLPLLARTRTLSHQLPRNHPMRAAMVAVTMVAATMAVITVVTMAATMAATTEAFQQLHRCQTPRLPQEKSAYRQRRPASAMAGFKDRLAKPRQSA